MGTRNGKYDESRHDVTNTIPIHFIPGNTTKAFELVASMKKVAQENGEKFFSDLTQKIDPQIKAIKTGNPPALGTVLF